MAKFKNDGQKKGRGDKALVGGSHKGLKRSKQTMAQKDPVDAKLKKISRSLIRSQKATGDAAMRAQLNG